MSDADKNDIIVHVDLMKAKQFTSYEKLSQKFMFQPGSRVFGSFNIKITLTDNALPPASQIYE